MGLGSVGLGVWGFEGTGLGVIRLPGLGWALGKVFFGLAVLRDSGLFQRHIFLFIGECMVRRGKSQAERIRMSRFCGCCGYAT